MLVILLKLLMVLDTCKTCEITTTMFSLYLKDNRLSGYYETVAAADQLSCISSCFVNEMCGGLAYHELRKMCYLYDAIPACLYSVVDVGLKTYFPKDTFITNMALNKPSNTSSTYLEGDPSNSCRAVDGNNKGQIHTLDSQLEWWCVDLEQVLNFNYIKICNSQSAYPDVVDRFRGFQLRFSSTGQCDLETFNVARLCYTDPLQNKARLEYIIESCNQDQEVFSSRFLFVSVRSYTYLSIGEVIVF